ncbi:beta-galactosamide-alpha-2,3-sialyltransferase [Pseudoalteromonas sp. NCCP-2140]|uniref:glycosyltransferase family 52 n=1 Tax=Pseudoalteromonas sp. NCCP-2140 TaxID=2942288 RepID=UPI00203E5F13|nr:glycosyltransferase family 52 [Pseudoalteromonas sp. NCCP-2140]GKW54148.1 beta-galactosamide-alpha-2,3-sialyltransferase [Pseudoalteromonas sp. NCCP-2140]
MNVFICRTSLQLYLSKKISKKVQGTSLYIYINSSERLDENVVLKEVDFYIDLKTCKNPIYNVYKHVVGWWKLKSLLVSLNIKKIFVSSIDNILILKTFDCFQHRCEFYSFDDGFANYNYDGPYYKDLRSISYKILGFFMLQKATIFNLKENIKEHYALRPEKRNLSGNIIGVELSSDSSKGARRGVVKIFIGTVYSVYGLSSNSSVLKNLVETMDVYLPHPSEPSPIKSLKRNFLNLAEIEVLRMTEQYEEVHLYGFMSTVLINLCSIDNVFITLIETEKSPSSEILNGFVNEVITINVEK